MKKADELRREIEELRDRLSRLNEASLRITEDCDLDTVLQGDSTFLPLLAQSGGGCSQGWGFCLHQDLQDARMVKIAASAGMTSAWAR